MEKASNHVLYVVTIKIDSSIAASWLHWMKKVHIPDVMATGCFLSCTMAIEISEEQAGKEHVYDMVYVAESMDMLDRYFGRFATVLQADHTSRYQGRFTATRRILSVIDQVH